MLDDYAAVIGESLVQVAVDDSNRVVGTIVLQETAEGFCIDNVAVRPSIQGLGVGRSLLRFAEDEALRRGYSSICLATHELMVENREFYERIGYRQYDARIVAGYPRVFLRKDLRAIET